jgi:dihydrofolate synthase/folylpolyglutamate synthase
MPLHPLIEWLFDLRGPSLKWELDTARAFSRWLGHPERSLRVVHVAGTNGKGSVAAMVEAAARAAGLETGLFTSPHLVCPTERIQLDGQPIAFDRFLGRIETLRVEAERALAAGALGRHPSFFEMITAAGLCEFAERRVDLAVLEVGLGGRLDATNVVLPEVSVITTLGLDHLKSLGGSLAAIASEKAGIVKPGVPVVAGWLPADGLEVVREIALRRGAPLHEAARELRCGPSDAAGRLSLRTPQAFYRQLPLGLAGAHQRANAALAVRALELLAARAGLPISTANIAAGLAAVRWPGRLEQLPGRPPVLLDAAHNLDGVGALARHLAERPRPVGRRVLVLGLSDGRDPARLGELLHPHCDAVVTAQANTTRAVSEETIAAALRPLVSDLHLGGEPAQALEQARVLAGAEGEVVVAGSLYLVGDVRKLLLRLEGSGHPRREVVPDRQSPPPARYSSR